MGVYTLVHCAEDPDEARAYGLWDSVYWWYKNNAEFTLKWELPNLSQEEQDAIFPLLKPSIDGDIDVDAYQSEDMIIVGDPDECLAQDPALRRGRRRQPALLHAVRRPAAREGAAPIELLGTHVIPELEKRGHRADCPAPRSPADLGRRHGHHLRDP